MGGIPPPVGDAPPLVEPPPPLLGIRFHIPFELTLTEWTCKLATRIILEFNFFFTVRAKNRDHRCTRCMLSNNDLPVCVIVNYIFNERELREITITFGARTGTRSANTMV